MTETDKVFFELIRVAIGNQICLFRTPSKVEWQELYAMAKKQSLVGICFAGVQKLISNHPSSIVNLSESLRLQWMGMAAKIQQRNEVVTKQCKDVQTRLAKDGYRCCILKGQGIAELYKIKAESRELRGWSREVRDLSALRQSGDIDVWIDADAETAIDYVMGVAPTNDIERKHIAMNILDGTEVEVHWVASELDNPFTDKRLKAWYASVADRQFEHTTELGFCTPTVEFNVVYLLLHLYEHFLYEGVGLRQVMDLYFVLHSSINETSTKLSVNSELKIKDESLHLLKGLGLTMFAGGVMWVLKTVFSLEEACLLCEPNEAIGKMLLDEIMEGGNFGQYGKDVNRGNESMLSWGMRRAKRTLRHWQYDPIGSICRPFIRMRLHFWTKEVYKKYNLK